MTLRKMRSVSACQFGGRWRGKHSTEFEGAVVQMSRIRVLDANLAPVQLSLYGLFDIAIRRYWVLHRYIQHEQTRIIESARDAITRKQKSRRGTCRMRPRLAAVHSLAVVEVVASGV